MWRYVSIASAGFALTLLTFFVYVADRPAVEELLLRYDIVLPELDCNQSARSRSGHCHFAFDPASLAELKEKLLRDRSAARPKHQNRMERIAEKECGKCQSGEAIRPTTQLGGVELPYLGAVYLDPATAKGCLCYEFGYG